MRQLTGIDASFLYMENDRTVGHVASLMVVDPSTAPMPITAEAVREYLRRRMHLIEPLRWRLVEVPFGLDLPYWADDPDVDLEYHVRGVGVPSPGTDRQLAQLVAGLTVRRLDRNHPLWEVYVIEGLQDGNVAIMTKVHHAAIDGKAGAQLTMTMLDLDPDPDAREIPPPPEPTGQERIPSQVEMLGRGWMSLLSRPAAVMRLAANVVKDAPAMSQLWAGGGRERGVLPSLKSTSAPRLSFNRTLSARRNWAFGSLSLTTVKQVKAHFECTVNDVVMAVCAGALRRWLSDHGELPDRPLLAMVPVSIRSDERSDGTGNEVSAMIAELPTHLPDPVERLSAAHGAMSAAKDVHKAVPARLLVDMSRFAAPAAAELVARTFASLKVADHVPIPFNVCISNVPGPRVPLYYAGAELKAFYPVSMVGDGVGLNITVQSYRDNLDFGLVGTPELIPDIWQLMDYFDQALAELATAAGVSAPQTSAPKATAEKRAPKAASTKRRPPARRAPAKSGPAKPAEEAVEAPARPHESAPPE